MFLSYWVLMSIVALSSGWTEDISKVEKNYMEKDFAVDYTISYYHNKTDQSYHFQDHGSVMKSKHGYISKFRGLQLLVNDNYMIRIDSVGKTIHVLPPQKDPSETFKEQSPLSWSYSTDKKVVAKISENPTQITYQVKIPAQQINKYIIKISLPSYQLKEITYFYNSKHGQTPYEKITIKYSTTNFTPLFSQQDFSHTNIFKEQSGELIPINQYKGYQIYSHQE